MGEMKDQELEEMRMEGGPVISKTRIRIFKKYIAFSAANRQKNYLCRIGTRQH